MRRGIRVPLDVQERMHEVANRAMDGKATGNFEKLDNSTKLFMLFNLLMHEVYDPEHSVDCSLEHRLFEEFKKWIPYMWNFSDVSHLHEKTGEWLLDNEGVPLKTDRERYKHLAKKWSIEKLRERK